MKRIYRCAWLSDDTHIHFIFTAAEFYDFIITIHIYIYSIFVMCLGKRDTEPYDVWRFTCTDAKLVAISSHHLLATLARLLILIKNGFKSKSVRICIFFLYDIFYYFSHKELRL